MNDLVNTFDAATIVNLHDTIQASHLPWNAHPTCQGVALKHLITGACTQGHLSCHLVRIEAGCEIGEHTHPDKLELHEVLHGEGKARLEEQSIAYRPGTAVVIPANTPHRVIAGDQDLYLLAKFTPALV